MDMTKGFKCPKCNIMSYKYPALSRRDNKTDICSKCGEIEAFEDYYKSQEIEQ